MLEIKDFFDKVQFCLTVPDWKNFFILIYNTFLLRNCVEMNPREKASYKEHLEEEEKFLKGLERNIQDHINRLKVEELSLLKLISDTSKADEDNTANDQQTSDYQDGAEHYNFEGSPKAENLKTELAVNAIPLIHDVGTSSSVEFLNEGHATSKPDSIDFEHSTIGDSTGIIKDVKTELEVNSLPLFHNVSTFNIVKSLKNEDYNTPTLPDKDFEEENETESEQDDT